MRNLPFWNGGVGVEGIHVCGKQLIFITSPDRDSVPSEDPVCDDLQKQICSQVGLLKEEEEDDDEEKVDALPPITHTHLFV